MVYLCQLVGRNSLRLNSHSCEYQLRVIHMSKTHSQSPVQANTCKVRCH